jgi:hypothetical protein
MITHVRPAPKMAAGKPAYRVRHKHLGSVIRGNPWVVGYEPVFESNGEGVVFLVVA